jgi:hypothetical protein
MEMNNTMKSRREFFKSAAAAGVLGSLALPLGAAPRAEPANITGDDRRYWVSVMTKVAAPVLENLARRTLRQQMPVEARPHASNRKTVTHLEAFGRLLAGLAPWLGATGLPDDEAALQKKYQELARAGLDAATDLKSPDFMNFTHGGQPLVDAAFLAQGLLRAPQVLWEPLEPRVRQQVIAALKSSRAIATPRSNNWVMFAATVEAALLKFGEPTLPERLEDCVRKMLGWYVGDGAYGDGEFFHFDYYNSFVIQPMLLDVLATLQQRDDRFAPALATVRERARRYAEIQERLISPEGTFPSIGRSTCYRFGAFQLLAQIAWRKELPERVTPAQVRCALTAVIRRMIEAPGTFDDNGWLRIGFCGHQPSLGEVYISTGSLYLCAVGLLPLGLPPADEFWTANPERWTSQKLWAGEDLPADHAIKDVRNVVVPDLKP